VFELVAGLRRRHAARRELRPLSGPRECRATGLADELLHLLCNAELPAPEEPLEQFTDERVEAMGADPAVRVPQDLRWSGDGKTVGAGPTRACTHPGRPGRPPEQPDGRLAVDT